MLEEARVVLENQGVDLTDEESTEKEVNQVETASGARETSSAKEEELVNNAQIAIEVKGDEKKQSAANQPWHPLDETAKKEEDKDILEEIPLTGRNTATKKHRIPNRRRASFITKLETTLGVVGVVGKHAYKNYTSAWCCLLTAIVCVNIIMGILTGIFVYYTHDTLPHIEGTQKLNGLHAPVTIQRDDHGIIHITADNMDDLFFAQGWVINNIMLMPYLNSTTANAFSTGGFPRQAIPNRPA